jgi:hypothetical protein
MQSASSSTVSTPPSAPAAETAAEIGRELLPKSDAREITVEVRNEHRQRVLTVTASLEVHRVEPEPLPPRW